MGRLELKQLMMFVTDGALTEGMLDQLMQVADVNKNGVIELNEFVTWLWNPTTGLFSRDVAPSKIPAAKSPGIVQALQEWFALHDLNNNRAIDYEEFAIARMLVFQDAKSEDLEDEFQRLDRHERSVVTWPDFLQEYARLLDAIPRPVEEKIKL